MTPTNRSELITYLKQKIDEAPGLVAIQAGHFAVVHDEATGKLVPGIFQDIENSAQREAVQGNPYMGYFPLYTWELGVELIAYAKSKNKDARLVLLCNDWQWVKAVESGAENPWRAAFYENFELPPAYNKKLQEFNLSRDVILPFRGQDGQVLHPLVFEETKLRKRWDRHFAGVCELNNACAQEYVPLLIQLQQDGAKTLISFVPKTCMLSVNAGSQAAKDDFAITLQMLNVFPSINPEAFWDQIIVSEY